ncbi:DNA sulfur modification protein DndD [Paenibacillus sp. RC254]|uniref:DNA sulfur modification protein DndD n=1 Tax=unclassified Paenibacillus TaxID=185978 RepID=UPI0024BA013A|nr:DNA sulfur modification protein DndD [Paenibacillus sp. RC334]
MQINKLVLRNIGAYYGNLNKFDFRTTSTNNVILLGGKNGAGKTTILESLRIVLFGSMAYGFITDNEPYFRKIRSLLNRKALQIGENDFQILLDYISTEDLEVNHYSLIRSWRFKNKKIKEYFSIQKNGKHLNAQEISDFQNRLREEMPPRLFELCLFDGEEISRIVSEEKIPEYLSESGKILFNLDLFMNLEKDLQTYRLQYAQKNLEATKEIDEQNKLGSEISELEQKLGKTEELVSSSEGEIINLIDLIKKDKKEFEIHGGLVQERRQELVTKINYIENTRKANTDKIRTFANTLLPFYIARTQLKEVDRQLSLEKEHESYEFVASTLEKNKLNELLTNLQTNTSSAMLDMDQLYEGILNLIRPENIQLLHRASFEQQSEIHSLYRQIQTLDASSFIQLFDTNTKLLEEAQNFRKAVGRNDQASEFKDLLESIENKTKRIEQLKLTIELASSEVDTLKENIRIKITASNKITEKIRDFHKAENSFVMTEKLLNVSQRFRERQWRKKLDDVAKEATKMINILFRKKSYIERMHIDHSSFELHLYNKEKQEINKERLSAGEKEMLMLSVIWAMFKVSGWKLPFVFDTLFGRLDQDHKRALIQHFVPKCGKQVLMFTTDSEIASEQFELIKDITSICYTLEFNEALEAAEIVQGRYFNITRENAL